MSTTEQPDSTPRWVMVIRIVSSFLCVLLLAVTVPGLGSVTLPNHRIGYGGRDVLTIAVLIAPLIVIYVGVFFSRVVEYFGWALAIGLFIWCAGAVLIANHSMQRTGASRSAHAVLVAQWRLAPAADAGR